MWKVIRTLSLCVGLMMMVGLKSWVVASDHPPLFPNFSEFDPDYRWFEPLYCEDPGELDRNEGFFFSYERVSWSVMSPPRYDVGDPSPGLQIQSSVLVTTPAVPGAVPGVSNSVDVARPDSEWGWGNRWEFGYVWDNAGWDVSVLGTFRSVDTKTYGVENTSLTSQGFTGSVAVLFDIPDANLLRGFPFDALNPRLTEDSVLFVPSFDTMRVDNLTKMDGIEVMRLKRRNDFFAKESTVDFLYGARVLRVDNRLQVLGTGGFLGDSDWLSQVKNTLVGPQVGFRWAKRKGRWSLQSEGRFMAAMNIRDAELEGTMASLAQPARPNNSLYLNPTSFAKYDSDLEFSPVAEARIEAIYHLTKKVSFTLGYTATYASNIGYGSNMVDYTLPELTLRSLDDLETQHFFANGVNFGFEINR